MSRIFVIRPRLSISPIFKRLLRRITPDPLLISLIAISLALIFFFYSTNFRRELEYFFLDTRMNLMPATQKSQVLRVVQIDDNSIRKLEVDPLRLRMDEANKPYLSLRFVTEAAGILANSQATAIVILLPEHAFPVDDPDLSELIEIIKYDPRFVIGSTGYNQLIPNLRTLPPILAPISTQIASAETFRSRSNAIVRSLPFLSYHGAKETINLPPKIAGLTRNDLAPKSGYYHLKFERLNHYPSVNIADLIASPQRHLDDFSQKIVVVGYTVPRSVGIQTSEQSFANTPLTGYAPTNLTGISTTYLIANAIENLMLGEDLKSAPVWLTLSQTAAVAFCCVLAWELGGIAAATSVSIIWIVLLIVHALLYRWGSLSIPLADTFLATVIVSVWAVSRRLRLDLRRLAEQQVSTEIKSELAKFQSHFLRGFATWLTSTTETITALVRSASNDQKTPKEDEKIFDRIFLAASDLTEYLAGINQLSKVDDLDIKQSKLEVFDIDAMLTTILRRFDARIKAKNLSVTIAIDENAKQLTSNQHFVDAILYNFISNAVKYTHDSTAVEVRVYKTVLGETVLSVSDEGPGIPRALQERVFERFYRINDARLYTAKGTGVGLYLCKFFTESLGGRIELISEAGEGSEFRAILP